MEIEHHVLVVVHASFGMYQLWHADLIRCPECKTEFVTRFADKPAQRSGTPESEAAMTQEYNYNLQRHPLDIVHAFESKAQRKRWEATPAHQEEQAIKAAAQAKVDEDLREIAARIANRRDLDGTSGQDRESYSDTQDRHNYT